MKIDFQKLADKLGLKFANLADLKAAFIHRSYLNESRETASNERLEFLGDAVLELVTTDFLYKKFPENPEGRLTAVRSALVCRGNLARTARALDLGNFLLLSRGEDESGGRDKDYLLANTVEALIGTIFLHLGYESASLFIHKNILPAVDEILEKKLWRDGKSWFQALAQQRRSITPTYELLDTQGPDHDRIFVMGAFLDEKQVSEGRGGSKQEAEENAARNAIESLKWG